MPAQPGVGEPRLVTADSPVQLSGDAHAVFTGPFYPEGDPLEQQVVEPDTIRRQIAASGMLVERELPMESILKGTLTFQVPKVDVITTFAATDTWLANLRGDLPPGLFDQVELTGLLFADGYGSVACTLRAPGGWDASRAELLDAIGPAGRDGVADVLRERLLPELGPLLRPWNTDDPPTPVLPYFNLTYVGGTNHPVPGRATLDDGLRSLLYPDTAEPLRSRSPLSEEFLYTGYAYHLLGGSDPVPTMRKLTLLLHVLNDSYARLANIATAADDVLRSERDDGDGDLALLARTERRLRAEYQRLITPTFSFDHHALVVRDSILQAWDVPKLEARADSLISMLRRAVEFQMAENHAARVQRLNVIILVLTVLSVVSTAEAAVSLVNSL
jgi:hypothetical protein